jgi:hypothetical protein
MEAPWKGLPATITVEPNSELHKEFRSLTVLLSLVQYFNSYNHPESTLLKAHRERSLRHEPPELELESRGSFTLNAITTLLARDVEVIAAAAEDDADGSVSRTKLSFVVAAQPREQENQKLGVQDIRWECILDREAEDDAHCVLVPPGRSHWNSVGLREWHGFKIR